MMLLTINEALGGKTTVSKKNTKQTLTEGKESEDEKEIEEDSEIMELAKPDDEIEGGDLEEQDAGSSDEEEI